MPASVRLDHKTEMILEQLAKDRSQSKAEVVRLAIELLAANEQPRPYELIADLVGSMHDGPPGLSENTGQTFYQLLSQKP